MVELQASDGLVESRRSWEASDLKARFGAHSITSGSAYLPPCDRFDIGAAQSGINTCAEEPLYLSVISPRLESSLKTSHTIALQSLFAFRVPHFVFSIPAQARRQSSRVGYTRTVGSHSRQLRAQGIARVYEVIDRPSGFLTVPVQDGAVGGDHEPRR